MKRIAVIGGGAAGMMFAIHAAGAGHEVHLYEKNEKLGKKLFITGKGRCNVTNDSDEQQFLQSVISNPRFLYSAIYNGSYMIPEIIITTVAAAIIAPFIKKQMDTESH